METVGGSVSWGTRTEARDITYAVTAAGWTLGIAVTLLVLFTPFLSFGYESPSLHLVIDSVDACVALTAAYLVHGRFLREQRLQDLLLSCGLLLLAVAGLGVTVAVALLGGERLGRLDVWLPVVLRVAGALLVAAASLADRRRSRRVRLRRRSIAVLWLGVAAALIAVWVNRDGLPAALDTSAPPPSAQEPFIAGHPALLAAQVVTALCFAVASIAFARQAVRRDDELLRWLGPACALAACARVNYLLYPSLYSDWLYTGDLLRTGFYALLLVGAAKELRQYWTSQAAAAVLEDRRRLARELHDGVMQELAYIRAASRVEALGGEDLDQVKLACDRALDEARAAVTALGRAGQEPLGYVLHRAAREMAERYGACLELDLDDSVTADSDQQHALVRITREATSNAVRHGGADRVRLHLCCAGDGGQLVIEDDGRGFDVAQSQSSGTGFGLTSMRDRALGLPGSFQIDSTPGDGTKVTVTW